MDNLRIQECFNKIKRAGGLLKIADFSDIDTDTLIELNTLIHLLIGIDSKWIKSIGKTNAALKLNFIETLLKSVDGELNGIENSELDEDIYIDPYENEYYVNESVEVKNIEKDIKEDTQFAEELDDDPDALFTTDDNNLPVKYNDSAIDLDPLAMKLFKNNGDLIDPPEVKKAISGAADNVEADLVPGSANSETVDSDISDNVIDSIADEKDKKTIPDDFDVFGENSMVGANLNNFGNINEKSQVIPPLFNGNKDVQAVNNIAEDTGHNLEMLSHLFGEI